MVTSSMAGWLLSSSRTGVFSSCCLALDSSSSFPCPAFRAIAKSLLDEAALMTIGLGMNVVTGDVNLSLPISYC
ncbi:hypothetical protein STEG23_031196 [Scotinomys teguina]